ncbi:MAG: hypothetical protein ACK5S6_01070 [bacterium]|jgi:hypothetical protein
MAPKPIDVTGEKYGLLTALKRMPSGPSHGSVWLWLCDCGVKKEIALADVRRGTTKSCGCGRAKDLTGEKFGRLTAVRRVENSIHGVCWLFKCDCGTERAVLAENVTRGLTKSCGCFREESRAEPRAPSIAGQRFGRLVAIERVNRSKWLFKCDCGNNYTGWKQPVIKGKVQACGCLHKENTRTSFNSIVKGTFSNPEKPCDVYLYEMKNYMGQYKIGIDSTGKRSRDTEYGNLVISFRVTRLEAWFVEAVALRSTRKLWNPPNKLADALWHGYTELRSTKPELLIELLAGLTAEIRKRGIVTFARNNLNLDAAAIGELAKRFDQKHATG